VSADAAGAFEEPQARAGEATGQPSEEELRAAYEAELSRLTSADVMLQATVSLLNIGRLRFGTPARQGASGTPPADAAAAAGTERDLEQVREAIDAVSALLGILERRHGRELAPLRDALSGLQMAYAREMQLGGAEAQAAAGDTGGESAEGGAAGGQESQGKPAGQGGAPAGPDQPRRPGPAEASGKLWIPGR